MGVSREGTVSKVLSADNRLFTTSPVESPVKPTSLNHLQKYLFSCALTCLEKNLAQDPPKDDSQTGRATQLLPHKTILSDFAQLVRFRQAHKTIVSTNTLRIEYWCAHCLGTFAPRSALCTSHILTRKKTSKTLNTKAICQLARKLKWCTKSAMATTLSPQTAGTFMFSSTAHKSNLSIRITCSSRELVRQD